MKRFIIGWYNGYYNVSRPIVAKNYKQAIKEAKELYSSSRPFSMGENPAIKCGIYGDPWIENVEPIIDSKFQKKYEELVNLFV